MWKTCHNFPKYEIRDNGYIRNRKTLKPLKHLIDRSGYLVCRLYTDSGQNTTAYVHRLVMLTFSPKREKGKDIVNHKNGLKTDPRLENLEWVTHQGNIHHAGRNKLSDKCKPVEIKQVDNGMTFYFKSAIDCSNFLHETKDTTLYRLNYKEGEEVVWENRFQYRWWTKDNIPWKSPTRQKFTGKRTAISITDMKDGCTEVFYSQKEASEFLSIVQSTLCIKMKKAGRIVHGDRYSLKFFNPWG